MNEEEIHGERCINCNVYTTYDDLYVIDTIPDEEGYFVKEIVVCKECKEKENA